MKRNLANLLTKNALFVEARAGRQFVRRALLLGRVLLLGTVTTRGQGTPVR